MDAPFVGRDRVGDKLRLDLALRPQNRLDDFVGGLTRTDFGQLGTDRATMLANAVARNACVFLRGEHAGASARHALGLCFGDELQQTRLLVAVQLVGRWDGRRGVPFVGLHHGRFFRRLAVQLFYQPVEPGEIVGEPRAGIEIRMVENSDRSVVSACTDRGSNSRSRSPAPIGRIFLPT